MVSEHEWPGWLKSTTHRRDAIREKENQPNNTSPSCTVLLNFANDLKEEMLQDCLVVGIGERKDSYWAEESR